MAETTVGSALKELGSLLVEEAKYLYDVEEQVEELKDELKWMQLFLQDVEDQQNRDIRVREGIKQMSWLAEQAEDIIESFIIRVEFQRQGHGLVKYLKRCSCFIREARALHQIGCDVDTWKQKMSTLTSRIQTYCVKIDQLSSRSSARSSPPARRKHSDGVHHENLVGLDNKVSTVLRQLLEENTDNSKTVVALCGVEGVGKTALAEKVYRDPSIRRHFVELAWAYIPERCVVEDVLAELYRNLTKNTVHDDRRKMSLTEKVFKVQQNMKCLVVLDNIQTNDAWDSLKEAFPVGQENLRGGKLMVTTSNESVVTYIDSDAFIYRQWFMSETDAWQLLKLRCDPSIMFKKEEGSHDDDQIEFTRAVDDAVNMAKEMLKHCRGLPWAINVLAGVLETKSSIEEWRTTYLNLKWLLFEADDDYLSFQDICKLGYNDLPSYLKSCFLYLGVFPHGAEISATRLIHLWNAEGFISLPCDSNSRRHACSDEVGGRYLAELVRRSLVQVGSPRKSYGRIKTCRILNHMREACLSIAAQENFLKVVDGVGGGAKTAPSTVMPARLSANTRGRYRRLAIYNHGFARKEKIGAPHVKKIDAPHVKSLLFSLDSPETLQVTPSKIMKLLKKPRFLRLLNLENIGMEALPDGIGDLVHLRYLSIRGSTIEVVPSSIGNLRCLQTLDLRSRGKAVKSLPDVIWRMKQLRHVYMPSDYKIKCKLESNLDSENLLEVLKNFNELCRLKDVAKLTNLRKLSMNKTSKDAELNKDHLKHIKNCPSLLCGHLKNLSFRLSSEALAEEPDALRDFSRLDTMKLVIFGRKASSSRSSSGSYALQLSMLPDSLTTLTLQETRIMNTEDIQVLVVLPNLRELALKSNSYRGKKLTFSHGGFLKLTSLTLEGLYHLEEWIIESGAMPSLQELVIRGCVRLKKLPVILDSYSSLRYWDVREMSKYINITEGSEGVSHEGERRVPSYQDNMERQERNRLLTKVLKRRWC